MSEDLREIIAAEMGDDSYECPLCRDYISEGDECRCSRWSEDELREFLGL